MNGTQKVHFHPQSRLYLWDGPFNERHIPEQAGFKFHAGLNKWATASPFVAYMLAPSLPELSHIAARIKASRATDSAIQIPLPAGRKLFPYQKAGIAFARSCPACLIADEPGLGKTCQAIGLANLQGHSNNLIISPAHLSANWEREIGDWYTGNTSGWQAVSYEHATQNASRLYLGGPFDLVVIDEAQFLKSPDSQRSKAILGTRFIRPLIYKAKQVLFLSGTPIPNWIVELWPVLRATNPIAIADCLTFEQFGTRFTNPYFNEERGALQYKGVRRAEELSVRLRGTFMVRRLKKDVLPQLPQKQYKLVVFPQNETTATIIEQERPFSASEVIRHGVPAGSPLAELRRQMGEAKLPQAVEYAVGLYRAGARKLLFFAHHRSVVEGMARGLTAAGYPTVTIIGGQTKRARRKAEEAFKTDPAVPGLSANLEAGGTGLNLVEADQVVRVEADWRPDKNEQPEDRICRIGQTAKELWIHDLVVEGSLDALILSASARKAVAAKKVLDWAA